MLGSTGPRWSEIAHFKPTFARSASAVTTSEKVQLKVQLTNRKSTTRFPMSLRWSSYVAPKRGLSAIAELLVQNFVILFWENKLTNFWKSCKKLAQRQEEASTLKARCFKTYKTYRAYIFLQCSGIFVAETHVCTKPNRLTPNRSLLPSDVRSVSE